MAVRQQKDRGSALAEFVVVLPFLLLVLTGLIELGKTFTQLSRLNQTMFEIARRGGEIPRDATFKDLIAFKDYIVHLHEEFIETNSANSPSIVMTPWFEKPRNGHGNAITDADPSEDTVALAFTVKLNSFMKSFMPELHIKMNAPYLKRSVGGTISSNAKNPEQAGGTLRNCNNEKLQCTTAKLLDELAKDPQDRQLGDCIQVQSSCPS